MALRYIKKREDEVPDIVERLLRYEECNPPNEVLFPLYMKLCAREEYPTEEECSKLGDSRVIKIHRAREKLLRLAKKTAPAKPDIAQMKQIVVETLQLETFLRLTAGMLFSLPIIMHHLNSFATQAKVLRPWLLKLRRHLHPLVLVTP